MFRLKQSKSIFRIFLALATLVLLQLACNFTPQASPDPNAVFTQAAQTIAAQLTASAGGTAVAQLTQAAGGVLPTAAPTNTSPAPAQPTATNTQPAPLQPTAAPTYTAIPPTATPRPTATPKPPPCDWVQFVGDVSVPDDSIFGPGSTFTKIWRLKNIGSCDWTRSYDLVYVDGNLDDHDDVIALPGRVRPGERIDIAVEIRAPGKSGKYTGYWMLRNADGDLFGIGNNADKPFWVSIRVGRVAQGGAGFDFSANLCNAVWSSNSGELPCPGLTDDPEGSAALLDRPTLENGRIEDELTIWMRPEQSDDGWISGVYPSYKVKSGDRLLADIGCLNGFKRCDVTFVVEYRIGNGSKKTLGEWHEIYDGGITRVNLDLAALVGENVRFILSVYNNGRASHANAFWLAPSVRNIPPDTSSDPAVRAAKARLAGDLGVSQNDIAVETVEKVTWTDSCLNLGAGDDICNPVQVPGFRIRMNVAGSRYEAHTNLDGSSIRWIAI